jgi:PAS domain S-box-containing protein
MIPPTNEDTAPTAKETPEHWQRLEHQWRIFDTTLSSITDFAYTFDLDGRFVYANQPLLDLWGLTLEEAVGKNFFDLKYPDELAARLQRQIQEVFDTGRKLADETQYTSPTGAVGYYEYIFCPVFDIDGAVALVAGSTRDVSERKRTEAALIKSEKLAVAGRLAAALAHEINNPLQAVINLMTLLKESPRLDTEDRAYAVRTWPRSALDAAGTGVLSRSDLAQDSQPGGSDQRCPGHVREADQGQRHYRDQAILFGFGNHQQLSRRDSPGAFQSAGERNGSAVRRWNSHCVPAQLIQLEEPCNPRHSPDHRRQRHRNPPAQRRPHLRAILHHQGRPGHRPRPVGRKRNRKPPRRLDSHAKQRAAGQERYMLFALSAQPLAGQGLSGSIPHSPAITKPRSVVWL